MSEAHLGRGTVNAVEWLPFAAAPTFAVMALLTGVQDGGQPNPICSPGQEAWPLDGMTAMYLLMSAFHSAPWLRLIAGRRDRSRR